MTSRLPGDDGDRHGESERVQARLKDDDLAARFREYVDVEGANKSDVLREALDQFLPDPDSGEQLPTPDDPLLARAHRLIRQRYDGYVMRDTVGPMLAQELGAGVDKSNVWPQVLVPLRRKGWLSSTMDAEHRTTYVKATIPQTAVATPEVAPADD